jgi:hypothetical protein
MGFNSGLKGLIDLHNFAKASNKKEGKNYF